MITEPERPTLNLGEIMERMMPLVEWAFVMSVLGPCLRSQITSDLEKTVLQRPLNQGDWDAYARALQRWLNRWTENRFNNWWRQRLEDDEKVEKYIWEKMGPP
jgi:hypothetical protein